MSRPILEVRGLTMRFGGLLAVNGVGLSIQYKQVVSMIGTNGAGKTSTLEVLEGNRVARAAYEKAGFGAYVLDPAAGRALFWQKPL